jgi:hypothetical protein
MNNRTIFVMILIMVFVSVLGIGMTLLFKDKTKEAMEVFVGGAFFAFFAVFLGLGWLAESDD